MKLIHEVRFDEVLSDLSSSTTGDRVFVRAKPAGGGAGAILALDAADLSSLHRMELDPLLERDRLRPADVRFTRHEPTGGSVFVVFQVGQAQRYGFGGDRSGEIFDTLHCTEARRFSDVAWHPGGVDYAIVSENAGVSTGMAHTEWPGVRATEAALDEDRIAALGSQELAVFDRRAGREVFRQRVGPGHAVALLPAGRLAVAVGPQRGSVRILDAEGKELLRMQGAGRLRVSPSGRVAVSGGSVPIVLDPEAGSAVVLGGLPMHDLAWLSDDRVAIIGPDFRSIAVVDVTDVMTLGSPTKVARAKPPGQAATKPAAAAAPTGSLKERASAAIKSAKASGIKPVVAKAGGKLTPVTCFRDAPAVVKEQMADCARVEVVWCDAGAVVPSKHASIDPAAIRTASEGQHHFLLIGTLMETISLPRLGAEPPQVDGELLEPASFWRRFRPFLFFGDTWYALSLDGASCLRGTRDMREWSSEPRSFDQLVDDGLRWLEAGGRAP